MTGAEALAALLALASTAAPYLLEDLQQLVASLKQSHPELGDAPPPDGEAKINAAIDAEITPILPAAQQVKP